MDDNAIREKLAQKFRSHALPRSMPSALHPSTVEGYEAIEINLARGERCCVCDEMITVADKNPIKFKYPTASYAFHGPCQKLWEEDRHKPVPRTS